MDIDGRYVVSQNIATDRDGMIETVVYRHPSPRSGASGSFSNGIVSLNEARSSLNFNTNYVSSNRLKKSEVNLKDRKVSIKTVTQTVGRDTAYVELYADLPFIDRQVFVGEAKRAPQDKANEEIALLLATTRALELAASKMRKRVDGLMKQQNDLAQAKVEKAAQFATKQKRFRRKSALVQRED